MFNCIMLQGRMNKKRTPKTRKVRVKPSSVSVSKNILAVPELTQPIVNKNVNNVTNKLDGNSKSIINPIASNQRKLLNNTKEYKKMKKMTNSNINERIKRLNDNIGVTNTAIKQAEPHKKVIYEKTKKNYESEKAQLEKFKTQRVQNINERKQKNIANANKDNETNKLTKNLTGMSNATEKFAEKKAEIETLRTNLLERPKDSPKKDSLKEKLQILRGIDSVVLNKEFKELSDDYPSDLLFLLDLEQLVTEKRSVNETKVSWIAINKYDEYKGQIDGIKNMAELLEEVSSRSLSNQIKIWKRIKEERIAEKLDKRNDFFKVFTSNTSFYSLLKKEMERREKEKKEGYKTMYEKVNKSNDTSDFINKIAIKFRYIEKIDSTENLRFFGILILSLFQKFNKNNYKELFDLQQAYGPDYVFDQIKYDDAFKKRLTNGLKTMKEKRDKIIHMDKLPDKIILELLYEIFTIISDKNIKSYKPEPVTTENI